MSDELEVAAAAGDGDAMVVLASRLEARALELEAEARAWIRRSAQAGSLEGWHAWARIDAADGQYDFALAALRRVEQLVPESSSRWVSVASDVLGRDLPLDSGGISELPGAGVFTIITPYPDRALDVVRSVARELLSVDELGGIQQEVPPDGVDPLFTPKYLELRCNHQAVQLLFDTEGVMTGPMGRRMVAILTDALNAAQVPAHLAGDRPDLRPQLFMVEDA